MGKAIEVTRRDFSAAELRELAASTRDGAVVRRLLAIAMILEGASRAEAARLNGMDRQTLCDRVHRYNEEGVEGLFPRAIPGRPGGLNDAQMEELRIMVLAGPDPERNRVIRWRCADLGEEIAVRWSVRLHERSVARLLHRLALTRLQPRPFHPKADAAAQAAYKKFPHLVAEALPAAAHGKPVEIWFQSLPSGLTRGTKRGSARRVAWNISGQRSVRARRWCATTVTTRPICSAPSAMPATSVRRSSCRRLTPKPWPNTSRRSARK